VKPLAIEVNLQPGCFSIHGQRERVRPGLRYFYDKMKRGVSTSRRLENSSTREVSMGFGCDIWSNDTAERVRPRVFGERLKFRGSDATRHQQYHGKRQRNGPHP